MEDKLNVPDMNVGDMISRQAAIDIVTFECGEWQGLAYEITKQINALPSAQPKRGKWIERNPLNSDKCRLIECDQCGNSYIVGFNVPYEHWIENKNYCEKCGADMRGGKDG